MEKKGGGIKRAVVEGAGKFASGKGGKRVETQIAYSSEPARAQKTEGGEPTLETELKNTRCVTSREMGRVDQKSEAWRVGGAKDRVTKKVGVREERSLAGMKREGIPGGNGGMARNKEYRRPMS